MQNIRPFTNKGEGQRRLLNVIQNGYITTFIHAKVSDNSEKKNWYPEVASYYYFLMFVLHIHFN